MVAQATGVYRIRHEVVAESVHLHQRRHARAVAEVVAVFSPGERGAGRRLRAAHDGFFAVCQIFSDEGEGKAGEVAAAASAAYDNVGVVADFGKLLECFFSDDCLVQQDVVQHLPALVVLG